LSAAGDLEAVVVAPTPRPDLPAPVEEAAYRICLEAVTNVVRHADARHCAVHISYEEALVVAVEDDGTGIRCSGETGWDSPRCGPARRRWVDVCASPLVPAEGPWYWPTSRSGRMHPPDQVRVVLADDHPMVRYGLRAVLEGTEDLVVVGEAADGRELMTLVERMALAERTRPQVVVTDLSMPGLDGAAAAALLRDRFPGIAVLVLTMHEDDESVFAAMRAGARGYLLKGADAPCCWRPYGRWPAARPCSVRPWRTGSWTSSWARPAAARGGCFPN
jgi:CheY-like chemotaxis protein